MEEALLDRLSIMDGVDMLSASPSEEEGLLGCVILLLELLLSLLVSSRARRTRFLF